MNNSDFETAPSFLSCFAYMKTIKMIPRLFTFVCKAHYHSLETSSKITFTGDLNFIQVWWVSGADLV